MAKLEYLSIAKRYENMTNTEKKIFEYFLRCSQRIRDLTISEMAAECGVGVSSITRFVRTLGYKNFMDFRSQPIFSQLEEIGHPIGKIKGVTNTMKIICMGDSITYGFGLSDLSCRWTDLTARRTGHNLINCGVSGDTTGGMVARCQTQVFNQKADALILLGGINDISILGDEKIARANVISISRQAMACGLPLILGVPLPVVHEELGVPAWEPNRDNARIAALCQQYAEWICQFAAANQIPIVDFRSPFLLADGKPDKMLFQDGLHPTAAGHQIMADTMCRVLEILYGL